MRAPASGVRGRGRHECGVGWQGAREHRVRSLRGAAVVGLDGVLLVAGAERDRIARAVFFNDTATTEIYALSLHDALPICRVRIGLRAGDARREGQGTARCGSYGDDGVVA